MLATIRNFCRPNSSITQRQRVATPSNAPIPDWVVARFKACNNPRYQSSLSDLVFSLLNWRFSLSPEQRFMVIPPAAIGLYFPTDNMDGSDTEIPDFIVTKAGDNLDEDCALLVVEVKPLHTAVPAAATLLGKYLTKVQDKAAVDGRPLSSTLFGMVVVGDQAILARLTTGGEPENMGVHSVTGPIVYEFLSDITVANWQE